MNSIHFELHTLHESKNEFAPDPVIGLISFFFSEKKNPIIFYFISYRVGIGGEFALPWESFNDDGCADGAATSLGIDTHRT